MPKVRRCRAAGCHTPCLVPHWYCPKHIDQEAAYLATRERWARGHDSNYQHKYNTITRNRTADKREQYDFYRSAEWQRLRKFVLDRDQHVDQYALTAYQVVQATTVDHIVPIEVAPELRDDPDNLIACTARTNRIKTEWEQEYYGTGQGNQLTGNKFITNARELPIDFS